MPAIELTKKRQELLGMSLSEGLNLDVRTTNTLEDHGIFTVEDLLMKTEEDIRRFPNVGDKTIKLIYEKLAEHGFTRNQT